MHWSSRVFIVLCQLYSAASILAEQTGRQSFLVHVPPRLAIQAPPIAPAIELPVDQPHVQFHPQAWTISANAKAGALVQFSAEQSFHHMDDSSIRRDAQLNVSILSQSETSDWTVSRAQAETHHQNGEESAAVQAHSTRPGSAVLGLTVTFLQDDALSTPGGEYVTTVVGTITEN